jgi:hypothetical protein
MIKRKKLSTELSSCAKSSV